MPTTHLARNLVLTAALISCGVAAADDREQTTLKVVGTWGFSVPYPEQERPFMQAIADASDGQIEIDMQPMDELGLKGTEIVKLIKTGLFDVGFAAYTYIVSGDPVFEGIDLALASGSTVEAKALADAYRPVVEAAFADIHQVKLLASYPFPAQVLVCNEPFETLADLRGRKIRTYSTTLGDMAEGLGGIPVSMPLTEVPTALQRGTIDCGVSSGTSMYSSKWQDVVTHLYEVPVGVGMAFAAMSMKRWDALGEQAQELVAAQAQVFENQSWAALDDTEQQGIACLTGDRGEGEACRYGEAADMTLVRDLPENTQTRSAVLSDFVLKRYAERCGNSCAETWNRTAGAVIGIEAKP